MSDFVQSSFFNYLCHDSKIILEKLVELAHSSSEERAFKIDKGVFMNIQIATILKEAPYGTLALCEGAKPYNVVLNFVLTDGMLYFHGSLTGRKMHILSQNPFASFSVVVPYALIPSCFSSDTGLACPATHFFESVLIEGEVVVVIEPHEKQRALSALMTKLQPEGGYKALEDEVYEKVIAKTAVFKLIPHHSSVKSKLGQKLPKDRFEMIVENLQQRAELLDLKTVEMMKKRRENMGIL